MALNRREFLLLGAGMAAAGCGPARGERPAWTIGANTALDGYGLFQAVDAVRSLGFPAIEIHPFGVPEPTPGEFPGFEFDRLGESDRQALKDALVGFRHVSTHLPFKDMSFFDADPERTKRSVAAFEVAMEATRWCGARLAVMHVTAPRGKSLAAAWPEILDRLRGWASAAQSMGFRLAVETGYPSSVEDFVRLVREVDHPALGGCIDVGHQMRYREYRFRGAARNTPEGIRAYNDVIEMLVDGLGGKLLHLHVHDIEPMAFRDHRPVRYGVIDYPRLFDRLERIGYRGLLMLEVEGTPEEFDESRRALREHLARRA